MMISTKSFSFQKFRPVLWGLCFLSGGLLFQNCTGSFGSSPAGFQNNSSQGTQSGSFTATLSSTTSSSTGTPSVPVTVVFGSTPAHFSLGSLTLVNATASSLMGSGNTYSFTLNALAAGSFSVQIAANTLLDQDDNGNLASNLLSLNYQPAVACQLITTSPPTYLGSRWSAAAYSVWTNDIDSTLNRGADLIVTPNAQTPAETQSFAMPFLDNGSGQCATITAQVQQPQVQTGSSFMSMTVACPANTGNAYADQTAIVAADLQALLNFENTQASNGLPSQVELDFVAHCSYYFIAATSTTAASITIPSGIHDLTIKGGTGLTDAAFLIFANPSAVTPVGGSTSAYLFPQLGSNGQPTAPFQDAIDMTGNMSRIEFTNLKMEYQTPVILNGSPQWQQTVPMMDFGTIGSDSQGLYLALNPGPGGTTFFDTSIRRIDQTDPTAPTELAFTIAGVQVLGGGCKATTYSVNSSGALIMRDPCITSTFSVGQTVRVTHDSGQVANLDLGSSSGILINQSLTGSGINDISFINVQVAHCPKILFSVQMNKGFLMDSFLAMPFDSSQTGMSATVIMMSQLSSDMIIQNSSFGYGGDDFINLHLDPANTTTAGTYNSATQTSSITIDGNAETGFIPGSHICFLAPDFEPLACTGVVSVAKDQSGSGVDLVVTGDISNVQIGDGALRSDLAIRNLYVANNTFIGGNGRFKTKVNNAYIGHNTFTRAGGLMIENINAKYYEGNMERNLIFDSNTFDFADPNLSYAALGGGTSLGKNAPSSVVSPVQIIRHLWVTNNTFLNGIAPAIMTGSIAESLIDSTNTISTSVPYPINLTTLNVTYAPQTFWQHNMNDNGIAQTLGAIVSILPPSQ